MEKTECKFGDILILEPSTTFTDLIITIVCVTAFIRLRQISKNNNNYLSYYPFFFLTMGLNTLFAALMTHAFCYTMVEQVMDKNQLATLSWTEKMNYHLHDMPNWIFNIISVTLFELSVIARASKLLPNLKSRLYFSIAAIESLLAFTALLLILNYNVATIHIAFALYIIELPLMIKIYREQRCDEAKYLIIGTLIMLITGLVMAMKLQISPWFNHNDISHVVIAITMWLFYKSAEIGLSQVKQLTINN